MSEGQYEITEAGIDYYEKIYAKDARPSLREDALSTILTLVDDAVAARKSDLEHWLRLDFEATDKNLGAISRKVHGWTADHLEELLKELVREGLLKIKTQ